MHNRKPYCSSAIGNGLSGKILYDRGAQCPECLLDEAGALFQRVKA